MQWSINEILLNFRARWKEFFDFFIDRDFKDNCTYSEREVPIFNNAFLILKKYENLANNERLFNFKTNKINKAIRAIDKKLGLNITAHSLMHNFITNCVENEMPEHIIKKIVGHSKSSNITKTVYTHVRKETLQKAIEEYNKKLDT